MRRPGDVRCRTGTQQPRSLLEPPELRRCAQISPKRWPQNFKSATERPRGARTRPRATTSGRLLSHMTGVERRAARSRPVGVGCNCTILVLCESRPGNALPLEPGLHMYCDALLLHRNGASTNLVLHWHSTLHWSCTGPALLRKAFIDPPGVAQIRPKSGQTWSCSAEIRPMPVESGRLRAPTWSNSAQVLPFSVPNLAECGPNLLQLGRIWAKVCGIQAEFGVKGLDNSGPI